MSQITHFPQSQSFKVSKFCIYFFKIASISFLQQKHNLRVKKSPYAHLTGKISGLKLNLDCFCFITVYIQSCALTEFKKKSNISDPCFRHVIKIVSSTNCVNLNLISHIVKHLMFTLALNEIASNLTAKINEKEIRTNLSHTHCDKK